MPFVVDKNAGFGGGGGGGVGGVGNGVGGDVGGVGAGVGGIGAGVGGVGAGVGTGVGFGVILHVVSQSTLFSFPFASATHWPVVLLQLNHESTSPCTVAAM